MIKDDSMPKLVRDEVRDKMTQLGTEISTKQNQLQVELLKKVPHLITLEKIFRYLIFKWNHMSLIVRKPGPKVIKLCSYKMSTAHKN